MPTTVQDSIISTRLKDGIAVISNATTEVTVVKPIVHVLEMEDVLFHHNSAVMMPSNPQSSGEDDQASNSQKKVSGVRALSLAFRHHEQHPDLRMLLAGHADRSGDPSTNFAISDLRAKNVLYLLNGKRNEWADVSFQKQKIEDYQQILTYCATQFGWNCDPKGINDQWNQSTKQAIDNFITLYNYSFAFKPVDAAMIDEVAVPEAITNDAHKHWPVEMWQAVFDLYQAELIETTIGQKVANEKFNALRKSLTFVDNSKPYVACGESFPISDHSKYRSQKDRRVEVLFFGPDEIPTLTCPADVSAVHKAEVCPLYNPAYYNFQYIDPATYFTALYHFKFSYFDRVYKAIKEVPQGLQIKAWKDASSELPVTIAFDPATGVYEVKVQGIINSPRAQNIHFTFETLPNSWVYSKDNATAPALIQLDKATYDALLVTERIKYYDLPVKWDSRNWKCNFDGSDDVSEKNILSVSTSAKPVTFCLDDFVLFEKPLPAAVLTAIPWILANQLSIFDRSFEIIDPDPDNPYWTKLQSNRNYFYVDKYKADIRAVAFKGDFYDVGHLRTNNGNVIGARICLKNDVSVHIFEHLREPITSGAGHFTIHFFLDCIDSTKALCALTLIHWSCKLALGVGNVHNSPDIENFRKTGMIEAKKRWEKKEYKLTRKEDPNNFGQDIALRFFFEDNPQINPVNCNLKIHDPVDPNYRSSMGLDSADFSKDTFQEDATQVAKSEDGKNYFWFTMAHELGHGCGLDDEYLEPIEEDSDFVWSPVLPRFQQWYDGMPYSSDDSTMMAANQTPRMRQVWHYCNWVNKNAHAFILNSKFQVFHKGTQNGLLRTFNYFLDAQFDNFYKTAKQEINKVNGTNGKLDLLLFKAGNDETTDFNFVNLVPNQSDFDSILVVRFNIHWFFKDHTGNHDNQWTINLAPVPPAPKQHDKLNYLQQFQQSVNATVNNTFWLEYTDPDIKAFRKTYIYFLPHHLFENGPGNAASTHHTITVRTNDPSTGSVYPSSFAGSPPTIGKDIDSMTILRYMLGLSIKDVHSQWQTNIVDADLNFIALWAKTILGATGSYSVKS